MRLSELGEFGLISRLEAVLGGEVEGLRLGIGDDAAVIDAGHGLLVITMDAMVEKVHFDLDYFSWSALGYKALAVNISDLAAMGARSPSYALVTLGLRGDTEVEAVEEMYGGMKECGEMFACNVVGGDVVSSPSHTFAAVSVTGFMPGEKCLSRDGALPGQQILVTGSLGESHIGLRWLQQDGGEDNACARRHLYPCPRLAEGAAALAMGASAGIDVSDGLIRDLGHICEKSGVGAELVLDDIPLSAEARETAGKLGEDPLRAALYGGEDYELILVVDGESASDLKAELDVSVVGRVTERRGITILDSEGRKVEFNKSGYEHFGEA